MSGASHTLLQPSEGCALIILNYTREEIETQRGSTSPKVTQLKSDGAWVLLLETVCSVTIRYYFGLGEEVQSSSTASERALLSHKLSKWYKNAVE